MFDRPKCVDLTALSEHENHICNKTCVDAHVLGCDYCVAASDGIWFCPTGAALNQLALKAKHCGLAT